MTAPDTLRRAVLDAMADQNVSQAELARRTGVHRTSLNQYLNARKDLTGASLDRVLTALGLTVERK